jgi:methyl-accepting chemotaxis protein-1 (serine sensor receptor)
MRNLTIKARLIAAMSLLSLLAIVIGVTGLVAASAVDKGVNALYEDELQPAVWLAKIRVLVRANALALDEALLNPTADRIEKSTAIFQENKVKIDENWKKIVESKLTDEEHKTFDAFWAQRNAFVDVLRDSLALLKAGKVDEARKVRIDKLENIQASLDIAVNNAVAAQEASSIKTLQDCTNTYKSTRNWIIGILVVGMIIATLVAHSMIKIFSQSMDRAISVSEKIAAGNLGNQVDIERDDEFGKLLKSLRSMDVMLSDIISGVLSSAGSVGSASRELSQGNDDLSQRTQEQAAALEETASSMEQMTATVKNNADNAKQANQLAARMSDQAAQGGTVVARAVSAMSEINHSSSKIADIIGVIDEIAFQTNLLALNAAVEAARAGEQGRGFAVVATEVRNLAQRSATAAKEIKELINTSVDKVKAGSQLVSESGQMLGSIVDSVKRVTDIVAEISAASQEQAGGIDQVNHAITQMDSVTQQNAALVEEAASASKVLEQQADDLVQKVSFFKLERSTEFQSILPYASSTELTRGITQTRSHVRRVA